jgi:serine/threonine-protein kinase
VAQIGRELCDILIYLHGKALVHQNIQPAHILAADTQLFLIDFGLSCQTGARAFGMSDSVFTAPEQRSDGVATDRVDIYALGQTLRVLLTGAPAVASIPAPAFAVYPLSSVRGYDALLACCGAMTDPSPEARPDAWNAWSMLNEVCREIPARFAV